MSEIIAAVIGGLLGGLVSFGVAFLKLRGRTDYFDDLAVKCLMNTLRNNKSKPMSELIAWGKSVGMTEAGTRQLVLIARHKLYPNEYTRVHLDAEKMKESNEVL